MNYENIEDQIVAALSNDATIASKAICEALPDAVGQIKDPDQTKSVIWVAFLEENPDSNQSINAVSQHYTATVSIAVRSVLRRGPIGIYSISEDLKCCLTGLKLPENDVQLILGKHSFTSYEDGIWEHEIQFTFKSLRAQAVSYNDHTDITNGEEVFYNPAINKVEVNEKVQICGHG